MHTRSEIVQDHFKKIPEIPLIFKVSIQILESISYKMKIKI